MSPPQTAIGNDRNGSRRRFGGHPSFSILNVHSARPWRDTPGALLIQHASYQWVALEDQPLIERGHVLLYRGIGDATELVMLKTGLDNIRLTTFVANESEVKIVDPAHISSIEGHGCDVKFVEAAD